MRKITSFAITLTLTVNAVNAACPTPAVAYSWHYSSSVSYYFPAWTPPAAYTFLPIMDLGIDGDINSAFNQWSYANSAQNPSNVGYYFGIGSFRVYAVRVNYPGVAGMGDPRVFAQTEISVFADSPNIIAGAQTTFYYDSISREGGFPVVDTSTGAYHSFVQKVMVHEIGHTNGLWDQPLGTGGCAGQTAGQSVMNAQCGTNDSANNLPAQMLGIVSCDNSAIQ